MTRRRISIGIGAPLLGLVALLGTASPVAAECTQLDPWPSFRDAAPSAESIIIGEVVEGYDGADEANRFELRVDEILRGRSDSVIEFHDAVKTTPPPTICPGDSILRTKVGDVIAFAFDGPVATSQTPVLTVAFVRGNLEPFLMPGVGLLTLDEVRRLAALPRTDTLDVPPAHDEPLAALLLAAAAAFGAVVGLRRAARSAKAFSEGRN